MFLSRETPKFFGKIRVVVAAENLQISNKEKRENKRGRVHINKWTNMGDPLDSEICFDIRKVEAENKCKPDITTVAEVLEGDTNAVVNISGHITFTSEEETVFAKGEDTP